jgi:aminopeptidase N
LKKNIGRGLAILLVCFIQASIVLAQRLPNIVVPENYQLIFAPNFDRDNFAGMETIKVRVLKSTSEIVLNAAALDIQEAQITSAGATQNAEVTLQKDRETATLRVSNELQPGPVVIRMRYIGALNDELRGFYLGKDEQGKKYAVTQFESTDARRAFPSFDEPAYKATFDISVIADSGDTVLSNSAVLTDSPGPMAGKHTVTFRTTPKMSSYLVALAVGKFEYIEGQADGIPIRIYSMPGKKHLSPFALATAEQCVRYFDKYFGVKYPFGKLDLIGLPDFAAGAMENAGLITFREIELLLDDQRDSISLHKEVAGTISHEIAHMWFGDLVTMQWWDDIWLNEGFATWLSTKPIDEWKPDWNLKLDDVLDSSGSLNVDALNNTRPIHQAAETPAQIQELFDGIAYGKTAAVLRMLEAYIGPESFRQGVIAYIKQHSYGNATAEDFWNALAKAANKPVDHIMPTFVTQPGAPMVSLKAQCSGGSTKVTLLQQRYFYDRSRFQSGSSEIWQIPVCMKQAGHLEAPGKCELLTRKEDTLTLPGCTSWVLGNAGASGFYRTGYQSEAIRSLAKKVEGSLTPAERIRLLSDAWATVQVGRLQIGDYLALAQEFTSERNRAVVAQLSGQVQYIGDYLVNNNDRAEYEEWVRRLFGPMAKQLGWKPLAGEGAEQKSLRPIVLRIMGYSGRDPEVLAEAKKVAEQALANPDSLDRTIASLAIHLAVLDGDQALYEKLFERLKSAKSPAEYYIYLGSLTQFSDPKLLDRTLQYAVSPDVRSQDTLGLIAGVVENRAGGELGWNFVRSHWPDIEKVGGGFTSGEVVAATSALCDAGLRDEVKDFFSSHKVPTAERTLKQSLESMSNCVDLKAQQQELLADWLQQHATAAGE